MNPSMGWWVWKIRGLDTPQTLPGRLYNLCLFQSNHVDILSFTLCVRLNCNIHLMVFVVEFEYLSPDFMYKPSRDFAYLCCV